ncbi:MAG TPA: DUF928 domain-containing protein [Coleofasciculaceae cyanobacterium]
MAWFNRSLRIPTVAAILALTLTLGFAANLSAQVSTPPRLNALSSQLPNQWEFRAPRGPGAPAPDNRQGGATRGDEECIEGESVLTALVPASGMGVTSTEYPTISWYMPKTYASEVEFILQNVKQQDIYSVKYALAKTPEGTVVGTPGIMSLPLPAFANLSPLELNGEYRWTLALICNSIDRSNDEIVGGKIKRIQTNPTLTQSLQQATSQERIALYANARLWYETLSTLVELRRERPENREIIAAWDKLLSSVGLDTTFKKQDE